MRKENLNIEAFEALPKFLRPSDYIDFLLFLMKEKPCLRLGKNSEAIYNSVIEWCKKFNYKWLVSEEGYMYISQNRILTFITRMVDDSVREHSYLLGKLLGYPKCCSKKIATIGEAHIDEYEQLLIAQSEFSGDYSIINPEGYIAGYALISHVPCCGKCKKSLRQAKKVYRVILENQNNRAFSNWLRWLI